MNQRNPTILDVAKKADVAVGTVSRFLNGGNIRKSNRDRIEAAIAADPGLSEEARLLRSAPGIGPVIAAVILAHLPELGRLTRREIASLGGLAPQARDSGKRRGEVGGKTQDRRRKTANPPRPLPGGSRDPQPQTPRSRLDRKPAFKGQGAQGHAHRPRQKTALPPQRNAPGPETIPPTRMT